MRTRLCAAALLWPLAAAAQDPLSAIDWLEQNRAPQTVAPEALNEPPVTPTADVPDVTVTPLNAPTADSVGLLPSSVTGLPADLWQGSDARTLADLVYAVEVDGHPAMQALLYTLLLAEADPPGGTAAANTLLAARVDRLIRQGAVEPAEALLDRAGYGTPGLFALWFDAALLNGIQDTACAQALSAPHLMRDLAARIYCLTITGDWPAAATALDTARVLGGLDPARAALLERFLDPEIEEDLTLPPPARITPLDYRLLEAIGEPPAPAALPRPFSVIALSGDLGWRAQLEAAERLAAAGAISENRMLGIYTDRMPAASGGIWDRVEALQRFETALLGRDRPATAAALEIVWPRMQRAGLAVPFAHLFAEQLIEMRLNTETARDVALLSPHYETFAATAPVDSGDVFLMGLARGAPERAQASTRIRQAIAAAWADADIPAPLQRQLEDGRLGEVILRAMELFAQGADGEMRHVTEALTTLRSVGLEDTARRAAFQLLLARENA